MGPWAALRCAWLLEEVMREVFGFWLFSPAIVRTVPGRVA